MKFAVLIGLSLLLTGSVLGAPILTDAFSYTNGSLITNSLGKWVNHSGTNGEIKVVSGRIYLTAVDSEDVNASLSGQSYTPASGSILYASFTINFTNLPSPSGEYFAHFKGSSSTGFRGKIFSTTQGAGPGTYRLGLANLSNAPNAVLATDLNLNTDYTVILRYVVNTPTSTLWINPTQESDPSITDNTNTATLTITSFAFRQSGGIGNLYVDNLLVGTNFNDVLQFNVPIITTQPQAQTVFPGANVTFNVVASGTAPFSYQWKSNNVTVSGATNDSFTLLNVTTNLSGSTYSVLITNIAGTTNSQTATLTVTSPSSSTNGQLTIVQYNLKGNFAAEWNTNAAQVQAIARQLQFLNPDIITLNEIPNGFRYEMTNWMIAFFPGYSLAFSTNNNTDDSIRNGVISRYSITRSNSWLGGASLTNFGYNGTFTRDLFEAQIAVPNFPQPLHVFSTHLKSGTSSSDDAARRAAEARCISNYFVTVYASSNSLQPYLLAGDMNEDINFPATGSQQPIQKLTNNTGLFLTTPNNPISQTNFTHSIQGTLGRRYDYILPNGLLYSNIYSSQVFRTDLLNPVPLNLNSNDDIVASDHLPVQMVFNNPYDKTFSVLSLVRSNLDITLTWEAVLGQPYWVENSSNLSAWVGLASNLVATSNTYTFTTNLPSASQYFRVYRVP